MVAQVFAPHVRENCILVIRRAALALGVAAALFNSAIPFLRGCVRSSN